MAYTYERGHESVKVYSAPTQCIYCRRSPEEAKATNGTPFGKEHIIPLSLYGTLIFLKASCQNCAATFNVEFERRFIAGFRDTRAHIGFRSRKNSDRPRTARMVEDNGWVDVPINYHPITACFVNFRDPPAFLTGEDLSTPRPETGLTVSAVMLHSSGIPFYGTYQTGFNPDEWARSLAKIAHSYMIAETGEEFEPLLLDIIYGKTTYYGALIGASIFEATEIYPPHSLGITHHSDLLVVTVGLFSSIGASSFDVVAGRRR